MIAIVEDSTERNVRANGSAKTDGALTQHIENIGEDAAVVVEVSAQVTDMNLNANARLSIDSIGNMSIDSYGLADMNDIPTDEEDVLLQSENDDIPFDIADHSSNTEDKDKEKEVSPKEKGNTSYQHFTLLASHITFNAKYDLHMTLFRCCCYVWP